MVNYFASIVWLTKRENGKTANGILDAKQRACCSLGGRTVLSHRLNYSSSRIKLFSSPARNMERF